MRRLLVIALLVVACSPAQSTAERASSSTVDTRPTTTTSDPTTTIAPTTTTSFPGFGLSSPAFSDGGTIPDEYTCEGEDVSPELDVVGIPLGTLSLVIIVDDPDAPMGTWDHWVEFDVPVEPGSLQIDRAIESIGVQGVNSWRLPGYTGPCPPQGEQHHYSFRVYALTDVLGLPAGVGSDQVYRGMEGKTIDSAELVGVYGR